MDEALRSLGDYSAYPPLGYLLGTLTRIKLQPEFYRPGHALSMG